MTDWIKVSAKARRLLAEARHTSAMHAFDPSAELGNIWRDKGRWTSSWTMSDGGKTMYLEERDDGRFAVQTARTIPCSLLWHAPIWYTGHGGYPPLDKTP